MGSGFPAIIAMWNFFIFAFCAAILANVIYILNKHMHADFATRKRNYMFFIYGPEGGHSYVAADMLAASCPSWKVIHLRDYILPDEALRKNTDCCGIIEVNGSLKNCNVHRTECAIDVNRFVNDVIIGYMNNNIIIEGFMRVDEILERYLKDVYTAPKLIINCNKSDLRVRVLDNSPINGDAEYAAIKRAEIDKYIWPHWIRLISKFINAKSAPAQMISLINHPDSFKKCGQINFAIVNIASSFIDMADYRKIKGFFSYLNEQNLIRRDGDAFVQPQINRSVSSAADAPPMENFNVSPEDAETILGLLKKKCDCC